ncbi:MAG TPA: zf-HC2 domain-containing protein [Paucimonas sp.]|nr:zf-HC2 domain-containing protein [Paucimonas sp.]
MSLKPTCKEVHRLVSEGLDRDLSLIERARMQMHFLVCQACQNFNGQMKLLRQAMRNFRIADAPSAPDQDRP